MFEFCVIEEKNKENLNYSLQPQHSSEVSLTFSVQKVHI